MRQETGMKNIKPLIALLITSLITACGNEAVNNLSIPEQDNISIQSREEIGGAVYENFRIAPKLPKADHERQAVKLTYLMNDDDAHQSPWSGKMIMTMDDTNQKNVHNIVFRDGGKNDDSRIYYLQNGDNNPKALNAPTSTLAEGVNEVQSNNPRLFSRILEWTFDNYPGKRKFLEIYTHGGGVFGIGTDVRQTDLSGKALPDEQKISLITPQKFSESLRQGLKGRKLDVIYFRACLMGNIEALYDLRGTTRYAIASEDVSYSTENSNIVMTKLFDDLAGKGVEPKEIAYQMSIQGHGKTGSSDGYTTIASFDLDHVDELKTAINELSIALIGAMKTEKENVLAAYDSVPTIKGLETAEKRNENMRDIWRFTAELDKRVNSQDVKNAIRRVRSMESYFMMHGKDSLGSSAHGLSIFMPFRENLVADNNVQRFLTTNYQNRKFAKDTAWDDFLAIVPKKG